MVKNFVLTHWRRTEIDDQVKEWFPLENGKILVKINYRNGVDGNGFSKKIYSQLFLLGSFTLSQSKRLMNDVKFA